VGRMKNTQLDIDTVSKRRRLSPRKNPYWVSVGGRRGGVSLGYRKGQRNPGRWIAKIVINGQRFEEKIGTADDEGSPENAMAFRTAVEASLVWSRKQHEEMTARAQLNPSNQTLIVKTAVCEYVEERMKRSEKQGKNAAGRLNKHVLSDLSFANTKLSKLRASSIEAWRSRIPMTGTETLTSDKTAIAPQTVNRLLNDLRAALNAAAEKYRRRLPAYLLTEIKIGTRREPVTRQARKQLLNDGQVTAAIDAAFAVDDTGDFGRLILLIAATGARHSQIAAVRVGDVQVDRKRVLVPAANKGRAAKSKPPIAIPLSDGVIEQMVPVMEGRDPDAVLLERWGYRRKASLTWERDKRRTWGPAYNALPLWKLAVGHAGLPPETIIYAFRHSSIVRMLRDGIPVRMVAALHDTSMIMIEQHYSAYILDATEEIARRSALIL
jgi:integrase